MKICVNCKSKPVSKFGTKFCGRSCSATYNNKIYPKRGPEGQCKLCLATIIASKTYCDKCWIQRKRVYHCTLREMLGPSRPGFKYRKIRNEARHRYKNVENQCEKCDENFHIEICHIRPIGDFPLDTRIEIINARDNILFLCPNCHWEFDHGR